MHDRFVILNDRYILYSTGKIIRIAYSYTRKDGIKVNLPQKNIFSFNDKDGYQVISLITNGIQRTYKLHRLVALHFLENPLNLKYVNHKDGNKMNNDVSNLEWCSASQNNFHAYNTKLKHRGNFSTKKRAVKCCFDNQTEFFNSIAEASKKIKGSSGRIVVAIKNKKKYKGRFWEYV